MIFIQINRSSWQLALVLTRLTDLRLQRAPVPIWRRRVSPRQRADAVEAASTYMMSMDITAPYFSSAVQFEPQLSGLLGDRSGASSRKVKGVNGLLRKLEMLRRADRLI